MGKWSRAEHAAPSGAKGGGAPGRDMTDRMLDSGRLVERMVMRYSSSAREEANPALRVACEEAAGV